MIEQAITVSNRLGLHARAAAKLVQALQDFDCNVWLIHGSKEVNAKSIMGVMMLAAGQGTELLLRADGPQADQAVVSATDLFTRKFDEGE